MHAWELAVNKTMPCRSIRYNIVNEGGREGICSFIYQAMLKVYEELGGSFELKESVSLTYPWLLSLWPNLHPSYLLFVGTIPSIILYPHCRHSCLGLVQVSSEAAHLIECFVVCSRSLARQCPRLFYTRSALWPIRLNNFRKTYTGNSLV
jgi:hypothetical protein